MPHRIKHVGGGRRIDFQIALAQRFRGGRSRIE